LLGQPRRYKYYAKVPQCYVVCAMPTFFFKKRPKLILTIYKDPVRTAQYTRPVSVTKTSQLMLYREIMAVCSEIHTKHINTVCGQNVELLNVKLVVHIVPSGV